MSLLAAKKNVTLEEFNVQFVKCTKPILIRDESKSEEENKLLRDNGYPPGYEDLLDLVFPPEEWEENGKTWRRVASTNLTNRKEMSLLMEELSSQMKYWQINSHGLCQIRRELYMRFFDEMIRQVCMLNIDLGELFIRIRDEFKMIMETYENIYKDCLMFTSKKIITVDQGAINELQNDVKSLEDQNNLSVKTLNYAHRNLRYLKENFSEELKVLKATNEDELNFFIKANEALKEQYNLLLTNTASDSIISKPK